MDNNLKLYEGMAKLRIKDELRDWANEALNKLIRSFELLERIDTESTTPLVSVLSAANIFREDTAKKIITRDELMTNALEQYDGYFEAPRTLE